MIELRTRRAPRYFRIGDYDYLRTWYIYAGVSWDLEILENRKGFNSVQWGLTW